MKKINSSLALMAAAFGLGISLNAGENLDAKSNWEVFSDRGSSINVTEAPGTSGQALKVTVRMNPDGKGYAILKKNFKKDIPADTPVTFLVRANADCNLETNFVTTDGTVYPGKRPLSGKYHEWTKIAVRRADIPKGWKVSRDPRNPVAEFQLGFSGKGGGTVFFDEIMVSNPKFERSWDNPEDWKVITDGHSTLSLKSIKGLTGRDLLAQVKLRGKYGWSIMSITLPENIPADMPVTFDIKAAADCDMELKFIDDDGKVSIRKLSLKKRFTEWSRVVIYKHDAKFGWKEKRDGTGKAEFQIGFSGTGGGEIELSDIRLGTASDKSTFTQK